jgi:hypothetical protein
MNAPIESIVKTIYYPCQNLVLKLKVGLGYKDPNTGCRKKFMRYSSYNSQWYKDTHNLSSAYVYTTDYLIIEKFITYDQRQHRTKTQSVYFSYDNIPLLNWALEEAYKWVSKDIKTIFDVNDNGQVVRIKKIETELPVIRCDSEHCKPFTNPPLQLTPVLRPNKEGGFEGAVMVLMGYENSQVASLNAQELWTLCYLLNHFDLITASMLLVNQMLLTSPMLKNEDKGRTNI